MSWHRGEISGGAFLHGRIRAWRAPDRYSGSIFVVPAHKPSGYAAAQFAAVCMFSLYFNHECIFFVVEIS